eukprot:364265-Chlamydomonas_euryale.AAC.15
MCGRQAGARGWRPVHGHPQTTSCRPVNNANPIPAKTRAGGAESDGQGGSASPGRTDAVCAAAAGGVCIAYDRVGSSAHRHANVAGFALSATCGSDIAANRTHAPLLVAGGGAAMGMQQ